MVDYDLFEKILTKEDEGYIEVGDFLGYDLVCLLANANQVKSRKLFKKSNTEDLYKCELVCSRCGKRYTESLNKTKLFRHFGYISKRQEDDKSEMVCKECDDLIKRAKEAEQAEFRLNNIERKARNTDSYIEVYLNPNCSWKKGIKTYDKIQELKRVRDNLNWDAIIKYTKELSYDEFLRTPYWMAIAEYIKYRANFRCQMCNSDENLITHHRTYKHHGDEIHHMEDLICICRDCHEKYHFE